MGFITSERHSFSDYEAAQDYYQSEGLTDGLPIVPPTEAKVQAMLDYAGLQPSDIIAKEDIRGKVFVAENPTLHV